MTRSDDSGEGRPLPDDDLPIVPDADGWVARMDADTWTDADEAELQDWLAGDPRRRAELLYAQAQWMALDPEIALPVEPRTTPFWDRRTILAGGFGALAASVTAGFLWAGQASAYRTAPGEIRTLPLADRSTVTLNSASSLRVSFETTRRLVRLDEGEAWFAVAGMPARPFVIRSGRVEVHGNDAALAVRVRGDGVDVMVTDGVAEAWAEGAEGNGVRLRAGEGAHIAGDAAIRRFPYAPVSVDRSLAWRTGIVDLTDAPMTDAAAQFNRYNARKIRVPDLRVAALRLDGTFRAVDPQGFALAMRDRLGVPVDVSRDDVIVIGRA